MKVEFGRYTQQQLGSYKATSKEGFKNGVDNLLPDYLDGLYNASVTHQDIVNDLTSYIVGKGLKASNPSEQALIDRFFKKKKLSQIVKFDLIQNTKSLEVIKDGAYQVTDIKVKLPKQFRVKGIEQGEPSSFIYRQSWRQGDSGYKITKEFNSFKKDIQEQNSIFWAYDSGTYPVPYGRPYYMSALNAIEMEAGVYLADNHGIQNGMTPTMIIERETSGAEGEDYTSTAEIVESATGPASAGKIIDIKKPVGSAPISITVPNIQGVSKVFDSLYSKSEIGILKGHSIPTPTLIAGLNLKATGFGDAEAEMQWGLNQLMSKKIQPYREDFIEDLDLLFKEVGILGEVLFEDEESDNKTVVKTELSKKHSVEDLINLGEDTPEGFVEVNRQDWNGELEPGLDKQIEELSNTLKLASTGTARPNASSEQDGEKGNVQFKVRYRYEGRKPAQREFCSKMLAANKLYRKEDIERMNSANSTFAPKGQTFYSLFDWKGGANCYHKWERVTFVKKGLEGSIDVRNPNALTISESMADQRGMNPDNPKIVGIKPIDTPTKGYLN